MDLNKVLELPSGGESVTDKLLALDDITILSPLAQSIKDSLDRVLKELTYMEDTGEEFSDPGKYGALVRIHNAQAAYFRKNFHI